KQIILSILLLNIYQPTFILNSPSLLFFFFSSRRRHTRSVSAFLLNRSSDLGMNIISNDGSNKLNRSRKARVSYKVQRTINASLNAATSTRAVSSNPNFVTRQKIEIIFG